MPFSYISKLSNPRKLSRRTLVAVAGLLAAVGLFFVYKSFAASTIWGWTAVGDYGSTTNTCQGKICLHPWRNKNGTYNSHYSGTFVKDEGMDVYLAYKASTTPYTWNTFGPYITIAKKRDPRNSFAACANMKGASIDGVVASVYMEVTKNNGGTRLASERKLVPATDYRNYCVEFINNDGNYSMYNVELRIQVEESSVFIRNTVFEEIEPYYASGGGRCPSLLKRLQHLNQNSYQSC